MNKHTQKHTQKVFINKIDPRGRKYNLTLLLRARPEATVPLLPYCVVKLIHKLRLNSHLDVWSAMGVREEKEFIRPTFVLYQPQSIMF